MRRWLDSAHPRGAPRPDLVPIHGLLRSDLTQDELDAIVASLAVRIGHSVPDPVTDDDILRAVGTHAFSGADEVEVYRVREQLRHAGFGLSVRS